MGASSHPGDVEGSASMGDFVDDLLCVLKDAEVAGKPVCIGFVPVFPQIGYCWNADALCCSSHDWGSTACWEAGRSHPEVFSGVVALAIPVSRRPFRNVHLVIQLNFSTLLLSVPIPLSRRSLLPSPG